MKLKALSYYDGDKDTRYGDCILLYDNHTLIIYNCGHTLHTKEIDFLKTNSLISQVHIVISHNDSDHTDGIVELLEYLYNERRHIVTVYSSLYLKSARKVLNLLDDERRTLPATKKHILETFDKIKVIVEKAQKFGFNVKDAAVGTKVSMGTIIGPTEDEFVEVVAQAIEDGKVGKIEGETVMNAASVQLKCALEGENQMLLLCGDASPSYLHNLDSYEIIQLPHHGQLDDAKRIFEELKDSYSKIYLVSDNTGSGATSGGSDKLVEYMQEEYYSPALNTKNGIVNIPKKVFGNISISKPQGVKLGEMDCKY